MTAKGYGIKLAELTRERDDKGKVDPDFVGRNLRIVTESGGEIQLALMPKQISYLRDVLNAGLEQLTRTSFGWKNAEVAKSTHDIPARQN